MRDSPAQEEPLVRAIIEGPRRPDAAVERATAFLERMFPRPREFALRLWEGSVLPAEGAPRFTVAVGSAGALRRMFRPPLDLHLGEAYVRGDVEVEGDVCAAFDLVESSRSRTRSLRDLAGLARLWTGLPRGAAARARPVRPPARLAGGRHSRRRDRAAIRYHYDVGNDFYSAWLDRRMIYSCGYFPTGAEDLDAAQERKLEHICRKLRLRPGERLLDIGCGWGGLVLYSAQKYGVNALGITLSEAQRRLAEQRIAEAGLKDRVSVALLDYRDVEESMFDKVASVGMFEHVGRSRFSEYFGKVYRLLEPGGLFLNHAISAQPRVRGPGAASRPVRALERLVVGWGAFRQRYVFPDGELVPVSEANLAAEAAGFEVRDVENLREHYARTLRSWLERLDARRADVVRLAGETCFRLWRLYMAASVYHFETALLGVNQTLLAKPDNGRSGLPLSRADLYA